MRIVEGQLHRFRRQDNRRRVDQRRTLLGIEIIHTQHLSVLTLKHAPYIIVVRTGSGGRSRCAVIPTIRNGLRVHVIEVLAPRRSYRTAGSSEILGHRLALVILAAVRTYPYLVQRCCIQVAQRSAQCARHNSVTPIRFAAESAVRILVLTLAFARSVPSERSAVGACLRNGQQRRREAGKIGRKGDLACFTLLLCATISAYVEIILGVRSQRIERHSIHRLCGKTCEVRLHTLAYAEVLEARGLA